MPSAFEEHPAPNSVFMPFAVPEIRGESDITAPVWQAIRERGTRLSFKAGTIIEPSKDELYDMYCVESGRVRIVFDTFEGRQRALMAFEAGGIFNLSCAIIRKTASGLYECMSDCVIWRVPGSILQNAESLSQCPVLAAYALQQMGKVALIHSTFLSDMLMDDFTVRFSRYLVSLAAKKNCCTFPLGITQDRCAEMLGVHRATLGRAIHTLKSEGILGSFIRSKVEILDHEALCRRAGI